jgi:hypothetical protein
MAKVNLSSYTTIVTATLIALVLTCVSGWYHEWSLLELVQHLSIVVGVLLALMVTLLGTCLLILSVLLTLSGDTLEDLRKQQLTRQLVLIGLIVGFWIGIMLDFFVIIIPIP